MDPPQLQLLLVLLARVYLLPRGQAGLDWGDVVLVWGAASLGTCFAECRLAQRLHLLSMCLAALGQGGP